METYLSKQAVAFLWAVLLGGGLGAVYDVFRVARILRARERPILVFFEDLLFALIAALASALCFAHTNYGQVRLFLLVGEALGFLIYFFTLGVFIGALARGVARILRAICALFRRFFARFFAFFKKFMNFLKKLFIFLKKWYRIKMLNSEKILYFKERRKMLREKKSPFKGKARQKNESGR